MQSEGLTAQIMFRLCCRRPARSGRGSQARNACLAVLILPFRLPIAAAGVVMSFCAGRRVMQIAVLRKQGAAPGFVTGFLGVVQILT